MFDFLRTYRRKPFYLKEHIDRLENSGKHVGLGLPETKEAIYDIVMETLVLAYNTLWNCLGRIQIITKGMLDVCSQRGGEPMTCVP